MTTNPTFTSCHSLSYKSQNITNTNSIFSDFILKTNYYFDFFLVFFGFTDLAEWALSCFSTSASLFSTSLIIS